MDWNNLSELPWKYILAGGGVGAFLVLLFTWKAFKKTLGYLVIGGIILAAGFAWFTWFRD